MAARYGLIGRTLGHSYSPLIHKLLSGLDYDLVELEPEDVAPFLAGDTWDSNVILQAAKGTDVDVTVTTFYPEGANPEFDAGFKEWVNADSTRLSNNGGDDTVAAVTAMGYDAYYFALQAIQNAGSKDPADVMEAIWSTEIDGVTGHIALEQVNGDAIRNTVYVKHANTETGGWDALPAVVVE